MRRNLEHSNLINYSQNLSIIELDASIYQMHVPIEFYQNRSTNPFIMWKHIDQSEHSHLISNLIKYAWNLSIIELDLNFPNMQLVTKFFVKIRQLKLLQRKCLGQTNRRTEVISIVPLRVTGYIYSYSLQYIPIIFEIFGRHFI